MIGLGGFMAGPKGKRSAPGWLPVPAAAKILGVTQGRVYHLIADGRLRAQKRLGTPMPADPWHPARVHVRAADVERYRQYQRVRRTGRLQAVQVAQGASKAV